MTPSKKLKEFDNKGTFVIGYRNLYNIVVLFVAGWYLLTTPVGSLAQVPGVIMFVLGGKWFLSQCRENLDAISIDEQISAHDLELLDEKVKTLREKK